MVAITTMPTAIINALALPSWSTIAFTSDVASATNPLLAAGSVSLPTNITCNTGINIVKVNIEKKIASKLVIKYHAILPLYGLR